MKLITPALAFVLCALLAAGCAQSSITNESFAAAAVKAGNDARTGEQKISPEDLQRLSALYRERTESGPTTDYPIGPGDLIEISCPAMEELKDRQTRVSSDGMIALPLMGEIKAGGLTEEQLRQAVKHALTKYMYRPEVDVFVKQYENRQVAVIGAVARPGLITLMSPDETILNVLTRAGGMQGSAADELVFVPADPRQGMSAAARLASIGYGSSAPPGSPAAARADDSGGRAGSRLDGRQRAEQIAPSPALDARTITQMLSGVHPLIIPLKSNSMLGAGKYLNMPVRPGDVIVVPGGGVVAVIGWVQSPGRFNVGSGLTVLGAIGAAGGPMYAANTGDIVLIRSEKDGAKETIPINLAQIIAGQEPDIPVKANDVIQVGYSNWKIGPYIVYSILTRVGLAAPPVY